MNMNYFHTRCDVLLCLDYLFDLTDLSALFFSLHPSKLDMDVLRVLESVKLKSEKYPAICRWKALIQSYPQEARDRYSVTVMLRCLVNIMNDYNTKNFFRFLFTDNLKIC